MKSLYESILSSTGAGVNWLISQIDAMLAEYEYNKQLIDRLEKMNAVYAVKDKQQLRDIIFRYMIITSNNQCSLNWIDVSRVADMSLLFYGIQTNQFDGDISKWDVSNVTNMSSMFLQTKFNGDISKWNVKKVTLMRSMFAQSKFDGDLSKWNIKKVKDMSAMFYGSDFTGDKGDISKWDVSGVDDISLMFCDSKFNQDISNWNISNADNINHMFDNCPIKEEYKPKFKK